MLKTAQKVLDKTKVETKQISEDQKKGQQKEKQQEEQKKSEEQKKPLEEKKPKRGGPRKVAILLRVLGEDKVAEILKALTEEEIQKVTEELLRLEFVSKKEVKEVLDEFISLTRQDIIPMAGYDYIHKILTSVFGPAKASAIMERMKIFFNTGGSGASLSVLHDLDAVSIANFIKKEHPQTMAVVLAYLEPKKAVEVLSYLPKELYGEVLERMAYLDRLAPGVVDEIGILLDEEYRTVGSAKRVGGVGALAEIVTNAPPGLEKDIVEQIDKTNPELAEQVRQLMFTFDDVVKIHDRYIGIILREVDREVLIKALKGASPQVKQKILGAMSERARKVLMEELEVMPPVRRIDVEKAQQEILKIIRRLEQQGEIVVPRGEKDVV